MSQHPGCATQLAAPTLVACFIKPRIKGQAMLSPLDIQRQLLWVMWAGCIRVFLLFSLYVCFLLFESFPFLILILPSALHGHSSLSCIYLYLTKRASRVSLLARPNVDRKESVLTQGITLVKLKRLSWRRYCYRFEVFLGSQVIYNFSVIIPPYYINPGCYCLSVHYQD